MAASRTGERPVVTGMASRDTHHLGPETESADEGKGHSEHTGIRVRGLRKTYVRTVGREIIRTEALRDVSLDVRPEEFVSLIGPSGCGKTTVLKILAGLSAPTAGDVWIGSRRVTGPGTDRATVFQQAGLMPWKSVYDNVMLAMEFAKVPKGDRAARADRYLALVGLNEFRDHYPMELSGGMQQRVGIARALSLEPRVLLMDEPFGALDAITRHEMQTELLAMWEREKKSVLFVTHSIEEALLLSDRVAVMKDGAVVDSVPLEIERPRTRHGLLSDPIAQRLRQHLEGLL